MFLKGLTGELVCLNQPSFIQILKKLNRQWIVWFSVGMIFTSIGSLVFRKVKVSTILSDQEVKYARGLVKFIEIHCRL